MRFKAKANAKVCERAKTRSKEPSTAIGQEKSCSPTKHGEQKSNTSQKKLIIVSERTR